MFNDVVKIFRKFFKNNLLALKTKKQIKLLYIREEKKNKK